MNDAHIFTLGVIPTVGNSDWVASTDHTIQIQSGELSVLAYKIYSWEKFCKKLDVTVHCGIAQHEDHGY